MRIGMTAALVAICLNGASASELVVLNGVVPPNWPTSAPAALVAPLPADWDSPSATGELVVEGQPNPRPLRLQVEPRDAEADTPARAWCIVHLTEQELGRKVTLKVRPSSELGEGVYRTALDDPLLKIAGRDGKPILHYWHGKPDAAWKLPLTSFIHPIVGMDGEVLTDLSPGDHIHHRGVFWSWVRHTVDEKPVGDWWHPKAITLTPGRLTHHDGPVFTRFAAKHQWVHHPQDGQVRPLVEEYVVCRVFESGEGRAIDVDITLTALLDGFRFGGTTELGKGYGGLTVRYGQAADVQIEADGRKQAKDLNQLRAAWADWSGRFKDRAGKPAERRSGIGVLVHPSHPDYIPEWITRFYGVLNVSYPGLRMLELRREKPLHLRYRLWVHRGDASEGGLDAQHRAYSADWNWKLP